MGMGGWERGLWGEGAPTPAAARACAAPRRRQRAARRGGRRVGMRGMRGRGSVAPLRQSPARRAARLRALCRPSPHFHAEGKRQGDLIDHLQSEGELHVGDGDEQDVALRAPWLAIRVRSASGNGHLLLARELRDEGPARCRSYLAIPVGNNREGKTSGRGPDLVPIRIGRALDDTSIAAASSTVENSTNACCFLDKNRTCFTKPNGQEAVRISISEHSSGRLRKCRTFDGGQSTAVAGSVNGRGGIIISCLFENWAARFLRSEHRDIIGNYLSPHTISAMRVCSTLIPFESHWFDTWPTLALLPRCLKIQQMLVAFVIRIKSVVYCRKEQTLHECPSLCILQVDCEYVTLLMEDKTSF